MSVANNNNAYRRGVLLGLTMAEIIVLIIFLLLLAFAVLLQQEKDKNLAQESVFGNRDITDRIVRVFSSQSPDMQEDVVRAIETLPEVISMIKDGDLTESEETVSETLIRAVEKLEVAKTVSEGGNEMPLEERLILAQEKIEELEADAKNLTDQKKSLISQIEGRGRGVDMPPCWPDANGRASEYLFNVDLTNEGIILRDATPAHRAAERNRLPLDQIKYGQTRSIPQFQAETRAIFQWSREKECRFYVFITDKTGSTEKALFKRLLTAVEGPFYKKLSNVVASPSVKVSPIKENPTIIENVEPITAPLILDIAPEPKKEKLPFFERILGGDNLDVPRGFN